MKFTLSWLGDHLETEASIDDITHMLVQECVEHRAARKAFDEMSVEMLPSHHPKDVKQVLADTMSDAEHEG